MKYSFGTLVTLHKAFGVLLALLCSLLYPVMALAGVEDDYFKAVMLDNPYEVAKLLKNGVSPNLTEPKRGDSGLILAVREESMQVFGVLLKAWGINLDFRARNGDSALMIAAWKENKAAVEALLGKGVEVNRQGWTALHYAAAKGNNPIVQLLIDSAANLDARSPGGVTPMMMAAQSGHIYTVKLLHDAGADSELEDRQGRTVLDFAEQGGHQDIVEGLKYRQARADRRRVADKPQAPFAPFVPVRLPPMD